MENLMEKPRSIGFTLNSWWIADLAASVNRELARRAQFQIHNAYLRMSKLELQS